MNTAEKLIAILFLLGLTCSASYGQAEKPLRFGLTGGLNASVITKTPDGNPLLRYNFGVSAEKPLFWPRLSLVTELLYSRQGIVIPTGTAYQPSKRFLKYDYLMLPVKLRFLRRNERFFIDLGGRVGYLIHNQVHNTATSTLPATKESINRINKFEAGLTGGIGYRMGSNWTISAQYYYGLTHIFPTYVEQNIVTGAPILVRNPAIYHRVVLINLNYYFLPINSKKNHSRL